MTKYEFSDGLRRALTGKLTPAMVDEHLRYYDSYIDTEIRKGRSEDEVLSSLGDPRLIAKTLLVGTSSDNTSSDNTSSEAVCYDEGEDRDESRDAGRMRGITISGWPLLIGFLILLVLGFVLFIRLLPLIIIVGIITWLISRIRGRR